MIGKDEADQPHDSMKFLDAGASNACRLKSLALDRELVIGGLSPGQLQSLFGWPLPRPDWPALSARPPISVALGTDRTADDGTVEPIQLADGRVWLNSNRPGRVSIAANADGRQLLLPQAFNLLLAQQWARLACLPLHACAFQWRGQGILVLGRQGSGKSSLTLAVLAAGAGAVSDDWLLFGRHENGCFRAERLRQFFLFRPGAVRERFARLLAHCAESGSAGRLQWPVGDQDPRFPPWTDIDQIWWLEKPSGPRPATSHHQALSQAELIGHLTASAMPVLLTTRFAHERHVLLEFSAQASSQLKITSVMTGTDLLDRPEATLQGLIDSGG